MNDSTTQPESPTDTPFDADSVGYDPITGTYHARFDAPTRTVVGAIVETVGVATDTAPTHLPTLYETIEPDALTALVTAPREEPIEVAFSYEGCQVTVSSQGTVVVEPPAN